MRSAGAARLTGLAVVLVFGLAAAGCSGVGNAVAPHADHHTACTLLRQLDHDGTALRAANVSDPAEFSAAMRRAVRNYSATLEQLRPEVPANLQPSVDQLEAAVAQYRFTDGVAAHASLAAYAARTCS
jgi:hypothetical protein